MRRLLCLVPLLPAPAYASAGEAAGSLVTLAVGLAVVLGSLYGVLWLLRRLQQQSPGVGVPVRVVGGAAVGPRERVVLLEVGDRVLVLGVAPGRVSALDSLPAADLPRHAPPQPGEFQARLSALLEKARHARR